MNFITDKQTLDDLNIFGRPGGDSIYAIFNSTHTRGGAAMLEELFRYPLPDVAAINRRSGIIRYLQTIGAVFPLDAADLDAVEQYLTNVDARTRLAPEQNTPGRRLGRLVAGPDAEYRLIGKGVRSVLAILQGMRTFLERHRSEPAAAAWRPEIEETERLLSDPMLAPLLAEGRPSALTFGQLAEYDRLIRFLCRERVKTILYAVYRLDVYISVAAVAARRGYVFPVALPKERHCLRLEGVYHPQVSGAVANTLEMTSDSNLLFLTGANMAGKSTFMKTLGIALYLAHLGFPVAAKRMEFSVRDGILTTINLPDNLSMGYSHFYAEVLRVKSVADHLSQSKDLFVIFDELFRGTNVKDAYEATVAIAGAFAEQRNCLFVISTHIIEAGEVLKEQYDNIHFGYLPTRMEGSRPIYTYTLEYGITEDRHGMIIINNERILEILENKQQM